MKKYSIRESYNFNGKVCPECFGILKYDGSKEDGWTEQYHCIFCKEKFEYIQSDMGQSDPYLIKL